MKTLHICTSENTKAETDSMGVYEEQLSTLVEEYNDNDYIEHPDVEYGEHQTSGISQRITQ